jgi:hypothetical protein
MKRFNLGILCCLNILLSNTLLAQNVWTQHNDQFRTGWYPYETTLNTSNVNKNTFGLSFTQDVDDVIYAQPLVVRGVNIPGTGIKNIVLIATVSNTVYAFDADANVPAYWSKNYTSIIRPSPGATCVSCRPVINTDMHPSLCGFGYADLTGNMGIVGTPVVDTARGVMYFVTKIVNNADGIIDNHPYVGVAFDEYNYSELCFHQYLHAIDIKTGNDRPGSPVEIAATAMGTGDGQTSTNSGIINFRPRRQFNRAGLALNNGILYIAFAAHCDFNPCHGWVMSFDTVNLGLTHAYMTTPNDGRGGIWMTGGAPAIDVNGNLYFSTGNSLNQSSGGSLIHNYNSDVSQAPNRGESVVKLAPDLTISSFFTPFTYIALNDADLDYGTQVMILPNTGTPGLFMTGCKDDSIYVFNMGNLGGFDPQKNNNKQRVFVSHQTGMHSSFAYFGLATPLAYQFSENSLLKSYPVSVNGLGPATTNSSLSTGINNGGFMSVSSNGPDPATGILWINQSASGCAYGCSGVLRAMNASDITKELWNTNMTPGENINLDNKFSVPTITLGKVYMAANGNQLCVYGPKANTGCTTNQALGKTATALTNNAAANNVLDGSSGTSWTSTAAAPGDVDSIYIDLGVSIDICKIAIAWNANAFGKDFDLKISSDKTNWTVVSSFRGNTLANIEFDGAVSGRYVSMVGIHKGTNPYSINEFQVFGNPTPPCLNPSNLSAASVTGIGNPVSIFTTQTVTGFTGSDQPGGIELGIKFRSSVAGYVTGVRFYKVSTNLGTHIGELYSSNGTRLAQAEFSGETTSGWQTVSFSSPVAIAANTTYVAAYFSTDGIYTGVGNYFGSGPILNGPLSGLATGTDGPNGVYLYSANPAFPTSFCGGCNGSNYWVDVVFTDNLTPGSFSEHLSWDPVPGANSYNISYRPTLSSSWINRTSNTNSIDLTALTCGTLYFYTVQTNCTAGSSTASQGSFTSANCPATTCTSLPTRYFAVDLGDIGVAGSTCFNLPGTYKISGSGDIAGNSDQFQYAFTNKDIADYDMTGRLVSNTQANTSSKLGLMVRDSLTNTSRFAYVAYMNNQFIFEYRDVAGAPATIVVASGTYSLPYYAKITKAGTTYSAYISPDNSTWTQIGAATDLHFGMNVPNGVVYGMAVASANNSVLSTGTIDNFSVHVSTPLPVVLLNFSAKNINQDHVLISWATSMEHLSDHFEILKSEDNNSFQVIDNVKAVGESQTPQYYSVNDNNPAPGMNYYRLKEIDKDGKFYYSPIVSVKFDAAQGFDMYPNPAEGFTNINSWRGPILEINVYDVTGKLYQSITSSRGQSTYKLNTAELSKGLYIIRVKTAKGVSEQKLSKQ